MLDTFIAMESAPFPVLDLSDSGFIVALAAAGRSHIDAAIMHSARVASDRRHGARSDEPGDDFCLFCRVENPVGGEEHVLSVALGNLFWILPSNVVCARCNNGVLSRLDTALQQHPFIALIRTLANIPGRRGQPPSFGASNIRASRGTDGGLEIEADHSRFVSKQGEEVSLDARWVNHGDRQRRATSRALLKAGLGIVRLARGSRETDRAKYDHVRAAVLGDERVRLRHGFENSKLPGHALQMMALTHEAHAGFRLSLDYFGTHLWVETDGTLGATREDVVIDLGSTA